MTTEKHRLGGMAGFLIVWLGQIISVLASGMTQFALTIWMYQQTSSATALGLMQVFYIVPFLVISPIAGVMVDRYNRKLMMMISDLHGTWHELHLVLSQGRLEFWMLYFVCVDRSGRAFQWPAYSAAIPPWSQRNNTGARMA
jgi:MFS family permease